MVLKVALSILVCYLLGSVSIAFLAVKVLANKDLRREGTGNLGGRNVSRILGKSKALLVIALDMGKGALAVTISRALVGAELWGSFLAMGAVLLGHNYSILVGFQGGKGLASGFGALVAINPLILAVLVIAAIVTLAVTRDVYKASLVMIFLFLPVVFYLYPGDYATWLAAIPATLVVFARHVKHLVSQ